MDNKELIERLQLLRRALLHVSKMPHHDRCKTIDAAILALTSAPAKAGTGEELVALLKEVDCLLAKEIRGDIELRPDEMNRAYECIGRARNIISGESAFAMVLTARNRSAEGRTTIDPHGGANPHSPTISALCATPQAACTVQAGAEQPK